MTTARWRVSTLDVVRQGGSCLGERKKRRTVTERRRRRRGSGKRGRLEMTVVLPGVEGHDSGRRRAVLRKRHESVAKAAGAQDSTDVKRLQTLLAELRVKSK